MRINEVKGVVQAIGTPPQAVEDLQDVTVLLSSGESVVVTLTAFALKTLEIGVGAAIVLMIPSDAIKMGRSSFRPQFNRIDPKQAVSDFIDPYANLWKITVTGSENDLDAFLKLDDFAIYAEPISKTLYEQALKAAVDVQEQDLEIKDELVINLKLVKRPIDDLVSIKMHLLQSTREGDGTSLLTSISFNDVKADGALHIQYMVSGDPITITIKKESRQSSVNTNVFQPDILVQKGEHGIGSVRRSLGTKEFHLSLEASGDWA